MVILVALAQALVVELILGAFLAGAITSLLGRDEKSPLREKLDAIGYGFFVPIWARSSLPATRFSSCPS